MFQFFVVFRSGAISIRMWIAASRLRSTRVGHFCFLLHEMAMIQIAAEDRWEQNPSLAQRVEHKIQQFTHGRIRNLVVEEVEGQVIVSGRAPSHHAKQLALHAPWSSCQANGSPRGSRSVDLGHLGTRLAKRGRNPVHKRNRSASTSRCSSVRASIPPRAGRVLRRRRVSVELEDRAAFDHIESGLARQA